MTEMEFSRAVIVGAGSSSSTPALRCVASGSPCSVCAEAFQHPRSRNNRLNPTFLIQLRHPADGALHNILIDCGKTFRESALKVFPGVGVSNLSAVLLTHDHADAAFGLDDLRDFNREDTAMDVFADASTMISMRRVYPYLFLEKAPPREGQWQTRMKWVASLQWKPIVPLERLTVNVRSRTNADGLGVEVPFRVVPIAVPHGTDYYANAFLIPLHQTGETARLLLYVSDISKLEDKFFDDLKKAKELLGVASATNIEVLVLDMMSRNPYVSHLHVDASIEAAKLIEAGKTYFIGMSHSLDYNALTQQLREMGHGEHMAIGYDGCVVALGKNKEGSLL